MRLVTIPEIARPGPTAPTPRPDTCESRSAVCGSSRWAIDQGRLSAAMMRCCTRLSTREPAVVAVAMSKRGPRSPTIMSAAQTPSIVTVRCPAALASPACAAAGIEPIISPVATMVAAGTMALRTMIETSATVTPGQASGSRRTHWVIGASQRRLAQRMGAPSASRQRVGTGAEATVAGAVMNAPPARA